MADWSTSSDPHQDSNPDSLGFGKSERLFHSANWAMDSLKVCWKTQDMYHLTLAHGRWNDVFSLRATEHTDFQLT